MQFLQGVPETLQTTSSNYSLEIQLRCLQGKILLMSYSVILQTLFGWKQWCSLPPQCSRRSVCRMHFGGIQAIVKMLLADGTKG